MMVLDFGGFHYSDNTFYVSPKLPKGWEKLEFKLILRGNQYIFRLTNDQVQIENLDLVVPDFQCMVFNVKVKLNEAVNIFTKK